jgi:hypothetical protein
MRSLVKSNHSPLRRLAPTLACAHVANGPLLDRWSTDRGSNGRGARRFAVALVARADGETMFSSDQNLPANFASVMI